jgi:hypothetical protein
MLCCPAQPAQCCQYTQQGPMRSAPPCRPANKAMTASVLQLAARTHASCNVLRGKQRTAAWAAWPGPPNATQPCVNYLTVILQAQRRQAALHRAQQQSVQQRPHRRTELWLRRPQRATHILDIWPMQGGCWLRPVHQPRLRLGHRARPALCNAGAQCVQQQQQQQHAWRQLHCTRPSSAAQRRLPTLASALHQAGWPAARYPHTAHAAVHRAAPTGNLVFPGSAALMLCTPYADRDTLSLAWLMQQSHVQVK